MTGVTKGYAMYVPHTGTLKNQPIDKPKRRQIQLVSFED